MLRILEDRCWLTDRQHETVEPVAVRSPIELLDRRAELEQLVATAPADQREFIERITRAGVDPAELQQRLIDASRVQDARRDWIIANWAHVIELEQITRLIDSQPALAHWPAVEPERVREMLDELRLVAPTLGRREERSLAEIDDDAIASDPVVRVEQQLRHLEVLAGRAATESEREAVTNQIHAARVALREARTQRTIDGVYARYMPDPTDDARRDRALTLAYDTLSDPPAWVVEHVRYLHDTGRLATTRLGDLTIRVVIAAAHLDQHRQLPLGWPDIGLPLAERVVPEIELSLPSP